MLRPADGPAAQMIRSALVLGVFALIAAALLAWTWNITAERIAENRRLYLLSTLHEVIPPDRIDNHLHEDTIVVDDSPLLGQTEPVTVYRGTLEGRPVAVVLPVVAPDGYNGRIELLVGIYTDGRIAGVRVTAHSETPGLGDDIEARRSDWIESFRGRALGEPPEEDWRVQRDGGEFDQFTGATVTPRAVVGAVRRALIYFERHRGELFAGLEEPPADEPEPPSP